MSVTSGFFNSIDGDRRYTAEQMSAIFSGVINDGVFASIGTAFRVLANGENSVTVGIGRSWFNDTWVHNDAILPVALPEPELLLDRIDAIVIEVDHSDAVRNGDIKVISGTPASTPSRPTMTHNIDVNQYPLAYVYRTKNTTTVTTANITNMVGTSSCPYITGILQVQNIDNIVSQWEAQWAEWTAAEQAEWALWMSTEKTTFYDWRTAEQADYEAWMETIRGIVTEEAATNLANEIYLLQERVTELENTADEYETRLQYLETLAKHALVDSSYVES